MGLVVKDIPPSFKKGSSGGTLIPSQIKSFALRRGGIIIILHLTGIFIYSGSCRALRYSTSYKDGANHFVLG